MKLQVRRQRRVDLPQDKEVRPAEVLVLTYEDGTPVPGQRYTMLEDGVGRPPVFTVELFVGPDFGVDLNLLDEAVAEPGGPTAR